MKGQIEKRKAEGIIDYIALAVTTFGVGYIPGAPGTYGAAVGVGLYFVIQRFDELFKLVNWSKEYANHPAELASVYAINAVSLTLLCLAGIWASTRTEAIFGRGDPSEAVVDEVMGQLITFCFIPFGLSWPFILAGFLLFRLFDIWKPYPIDDLQDLPGGLGICADDIVAGVYAGICLAIGYAVTLFF